MRIGMNRRDYERLKSRELNIPPGRKLSDVESYPKTATQAASEAYYRGYDLRDTDGKGNARNAEEKMKNLVRRGYVELSDLPTKAKWTKEAIDAACNHFEGNGDFAPFASFCANWDVSFADYQAALFDAYDSAINEYGVAAIRRVPSPSEEHFTLHIESARKNAKRGRVWFTLREDARSEISSRLNQ